MSFVVKGSQNRLFLDELKNQDNIRVEEKSLSMRSYGARWGNILAKCGFAYKVKVDADKFHYVNKKSFINYQVRIDCCHGDSVADMIQKLKGVYALEKSKGMSSKAYAFYHLKAAKLEDQPGFKELQNKAPENLKAAEDEFMGDFKVYHKNLLSLRSDIRKDCDTQQKVKGYVNLT